MCELLEGVVVTLYVFWSEIILWQWNLSQLFDKELLSIVFLSDKTSHLALLLLHDSLELAEPPSTGVVVVVVEVVFVDKLWLPRQVNPR